MALTDPTAPFNFDPFAPTWDDEREAAMLASLFPQPAPALPVDPSLEQLANSGAGPTPPSPPPPPTQNLGPLLGAPPQDVEVARGTQDAPADPAPDARHIEMPDDPVIRLPFEADATSGISTPPEDARAPGTVTGELLDPQNPYTGINSPDVEEQTRARVEMASKDPEGYARLVAKEEDDARQRKLEAENQILIDDEKRRLEAQKLVDAARTKAEQYAAQVEADAAELAKQKVDPDRWWSNRSVPQKIAGFIAAIVGGLAQSATGGRNVGLDMINQAIDQDIDAQKANIANGRADLARRQGVVAEMYARTGDLERSTEAARRAAKEQAIQKLEIELQKYDPSGTTARAITQQIVAGRAQAAQNREKWAQQQLENGIKVADLQLKQLDILAKQKKLAGGTGAPVYKPEYFVAKGLKAPPWAMSEKDYATWQSQQKAEKDLNKAPGGDKSEAQLRKEEADAVEAEAKAEAAKTGYQLKNPETGDVITNPDGTPVVEMDATKRNRASSIMEAAANVRRLADRMSELKKAYGGASKLLGTKEAQEIQQLVSQIDFETFKAFDLGAPSAGDRDLAEGVRGGADPLSFIKDATPGFQAYADAVERKANTAIRNSGYKGAAIKFRRAADLKKTEPSVVDEFSAKIAKAEYAPHDPMKQPLRFVLPQEAQVNKETEEAFSILAAYAERASDSGEEAKKALKELAERAVSPAARAKAKAILDSVPGGKARREGAR